MDEIIPVILRTVLRHPLQQGAVPVHWTIRSPEPAIAYDEHIRNPQKILTGRQHPQGLVQSVRTRTHRHAFPGYNVSSCKSPAVWSK